MRGVVFSSVMPCAAVVGVASLTVQYSPMTAWYGRNLSLHQVHSGEEAFRFSSSVWKETMMRFFHFVTLVLLFISLSGDNVFGAPSKGKYMWVKCNPNGLDPNCVPQVGPWMKLPGPKQRLPSSATKDLATVESNEDEPDTDEISGDGSGDRGPIELPNKSQHDEPEQGVQQAEELSIEYGSGDTESSNFVFPEHFLKPKLSAKDLAEEYMIQ